MPVCWSEIALLPWTMMSLSKFETAFAVIKKATDTVAQPASPFQARTRKVPLSKGVVPKSDSAWCLGRLGVVLC